MERTETAISLHADFRLVPSRISWHRGACPSGAVSNCEAFP